MNQPKVVNKVHTSESQLFVTSDGIEFSDLKEAERYEYYQIQLQQRSFSIPENDILNFETVEQVRDFIESHYYKDTRLTFSYEDLSFPNTYVFVEESDEVIENNGEDDIWLRARTKLEIYTLKEFKKMMIRSIANFE